MNKIVWFNGVDFGIRDARGMLHYPKPEELSKYASKNEIAAAVHQYEASLMPLPSYDVASGQYYWSDPSDLWDAEDVAEDIKLLWPLMDSDLLLELARLQAKLVTI